MTTVQEEAQYELLPTGKPNISFSELKVWTECSWRHKLQFVDKIDLSKPGVWLDFGKAVHSGCESFIKTGNLDIDSVENYLRDSWKEHLHPQNQLEPLVTEARGIMADIPAFFNAEFPEWKPIAAEYFLFERIGDKPHAFKGYIDCIITAPGKRNKQLMWILDAKTCSWGWDPKHKSDPTVRAQLILYKNFWCAKHPDVDPQNVRCGFVLLKRSAKPGRHCELVTVSAGDVAIEKSVKMVNNMLGCLKRGFAMKNRNSCQYCEYKDTPHCK